MQATLYFTARDASSPAHASSSPPGDRTRWLRVSTFCVAPPWKVCTQLHVISVLTELLLARADERTDSSHTYKIHTYHFLTFTAKFQQNRQKDSHNAPLVFLFICPHHNSLSTF